MSHDSESWLSADAAIPSPDSVSTDTAFSILAHEHRRLAVSYLSETDGPVSVTELADHLASELETADDSELVRKRLATLLHHTHLPKMEDAGIIAYDRDERTIDTTEAFSGISSTLPFE